MSESSNAVPSTSAPRTSIVVVGSMNMDLVVRVARHPVPGETLLGSDYASYPGGKGANQAVAAARLSQPNRSEQHRLGPTVSFVGASGGDEYGEKLLASLQGAGVDTSACFVSARPTGVAFIQVAGDGQNSIVVAPGANGDVTSDFVRSSAVAELIAAAAVVLLQLEVPVDATLAAAATARRSGAFTILNLAPAQRLSAADLSAVDLLLVNESEARIQLGDDAAAASGHTLAADEAKSVAFALTRYVPNVVVTLGAGGAAWAVRQPAAAGVVAGFVVTVVDTTAAGDAFAGALAWRLASLGSSRASNWLAEAVRFANAAGALTTTRTGAQPSLPKLAEVETLLAVDGL